MKSLFDVLKEKDFNLKKLSKVERLRYAGILKEQDKKERQIMLENMKNQAGAEKNNFKIPFFL